MVALSRQGPTSGGSGSITADAHRAPPVRDLIGGGVIRLGLRTGRSLCRKRRRDERGGWRRWATGPSVFTAVGNRGVGSRRQFFVFLDFYAFSVCCSFFFLSSFFVHFSVVFSVLFVSALALFPFRLCFLVSRHA